MYDGSTLTGVTGINVEGTLYDVTFGDALFSQSITAFTDSYSAHIASSALANTLRPWITEHWNGSFQLRGTDVYDSANTALYLSIVTPFTTSTQSEQFGTLAVGVSSSVYLSEPNIESQPYDSFLINDNSGYFSVDNMASWRSDQTVAKWSVSNTAPVPEPETYAMFLAGLGLMGFVARRKKVA